MKLASILLTMAVCTATLLGPSSPVFNEDSPPEWLFPPGTMSSEDEDQEEPKVSLPPEGTAAPEEVDAAPKEEEGTQEPEDTSFTIDISMVGDCMLATHKGGFYKGSFSWYAAREEPYYFLEKVRDIFKADDFTIANLENVLTDQDLEEVEKSSTPAYWFKGPAYNIYLLRGGSVEAVSLANNHTGDYGKQGLKDTIAAVEMAGLDYGTNSRTFYLEKNGFRIAVICHGLWKETQATQIVTRIQEASKASDYQIVFYHGGAEGVHEPEEWKVRASHRLVDAGADLVVGNHPHVLQPTEVYKGVNIVYSLGNFCYGGHTKPENRTVIYKILLTVDGGSVQKEEISLIPCYVYTGKTNNWQPAPITDEAEKQKVLDFMYGRRKLPY